MSRKPSFANLRDRALTAPAPIPAAISSKPETSTASERTERAGEGAAPPPRAASREGRKQIAGFFTPEMSLAMHMLARRQNRSLQALMAEAFNDVLRKYGESPIGE